MAFKLYIDEDAMSHALVEGLRARGVDVVSVLDAELTGREDEVQLEFAAKQTRVLYSYNVEDFGRLHSTFLQQGKVHAGIIVVNRQKLSLGQQIRGLLKLVNSRNTEDMKNSLEFLHE